MIVLTKECLPKLRFKNELCEVKCGIHVPRFLLWRNSFFDKITQELHRNRKEATNRNLQPLVITGAPGMNRTCDTRIRNPVLYPLSYGGGMVCVLLT